MKEWWSLPELADAKLPGLPHTVPALNNMALRKGWRNDPAKVRRLEGRGGGYAYHVAVLPEAARAKLAFLDASPPPAEASSKLLWRRYEALTDAQRDICRQRLDVLTAWEALRAAGLSAGQATAHCAARYNVSIRTIFVWRQAVEGHARQDWLAALAPETGSGNGVVAQVAECHPMAWEALAADYLRPEAPRFSACYRRMVEIAQRKGWSPIPAERTLRRHMDAKVPHAVQVLARKGQEEARKLFPAQERSVAHLMAMQYVNTDGHKLDLQVRMPGRDKPTRVYLMATQDVYSRKILSWVLTEAETWEAVRTMVGRMVEDHGIPERLYMDNGRSFASKKISGGAQRRHRFRITEDEVAGLLKTLGIEGRFVTPYRGQSKPIERAWGDLAEAIAKHPDVAGAYTGRSTQHKPENYGKHAVPFHELEQHVAARIAEHNARAGRRTETAKGRSFDEVFAASMADPANLVRFASPAQRSLWMLTAETITARKPAGAIHLHGNRYWSRELNEWIGRKLTVRFDPSDLHAAVKVYDPKGRLICDAECIDKSGYDCQAAAREQARASGEAAKALKAQKAAARRLTDLELKELMKRGDREVAAKPVRPKVTRLITQRQQAPAASAAELIDEQKFQDDFNRGLSRLAGGEAAILPFPKGDLRRTD